MPWQDNGLLAEVRPGHRDGFRSCPSGPDVTKKGINTAVGYEGPLVPCLGLDYGLGLAEA